MAMFSAANDFQGTALQGSHRPAFHRQRIDCLAVFDDLFQGWQNR
jgi:hypothetical protein